MNDDPQHLFLIDGSGFIFRAYFADIRRRDRLQRSDGTPTNAVYGFTQMLIKRLDDTEADYVAVIFDRARKTFRNDIYPDYKANRDEPPEDLVPQFALVREATHALNVPAVDMEGFEADDLIATYARQAREKGMEVTIVSSDKDLMQLVRPGVVMLDPVAEKVIGEDEVIEKFGVGPDRVVDVQALAGDSSDNVPGVAGIGVKTAAELINEYGDLEMVLARAEEIKQPKRRENLINQAENARLSKQLVKLKDDVPVEASLGSFAKERWNYKTLVPWLIDQEFDSIITRLRGRGSDEIQRLFDQEILRTLAKFPPSVIANRFSKTIAALSSVDPRTRGEEFSVNLNAIKSAIQTGDDDSVEFSEPQQKDQGYVLVQDEAALERWIADATRAGVVAFDTETTSLDATRAELVGVSLSFEPGRACYVPLGHRRPAAQGALDLDGDGGRSRDGDAPRQIAIEKAIEMLKPMLEDPSVLKVGQNIKYDMEIMAAHGIEIAPVDDTMLLSFVLEGGLHGHGMDDLAEIFLDHQTIKFGDVTGTGKAQVTFDRVPLEKALDYAAEDADVTGRLHRIFKPRLATEHMATVYETLERPLIPVLKAMELHGIKVDGKELRRLSDDFARRLGDLEREIHELAGHEFNIGSPKQLGEVLFDEMGLPGGKKGKTGAYGTGADVLEALVDHGHALPARVLDWRQLAKLKSTYTDALIEQINPKTGRVHTSYSQAGAATGRLASSDPNLQNIPVRTEEGRKIRRAFVADKGTVLLSADYSQIELRLLAHVADIKALKDAFRDGHDIHAMTASQVFGVPIEGMDPMVRRKAKAINFGIIYGISPFGLARQLGIGNSEAAEYIDAYFEKYPGIRDYMERTKEHARKHGYVTTLFGRKCHTRRINEKNPNIRGLAERAAINAPIQGGAADIIKRAMIRLPEALAAKKLKARMLLQVHDELIFEVPKKEAETTAEVVSGVMSGAATLDVPLVVDTGTGPNWDEAH